MKNAIILIIFSLSTFWVTSAWPCTNFLITKKASADGSTMITYSADSHQLYGELYYTAAAVHPDGAMREVYEWDSGKFLGKIPQVKETFSVIGNMNEHQLAIGETTFGGRKELKDPDGKIDYGSLIYIALERAKTARDAIGVMTDLVAKYGYSSSGESFSIIDPSEVWIMEMIGKGKGNKGVVWVARKIPDGSISAHANQARIHQFPLNDKRNTLYSKDVISFAKEKKFFKGNDKDFSFADAYAPLDFGGARYCEARVWAMFNRAAKKAKISPDFAKGVHGAKPMPLWVKPDKKLTPHDVMELMRDHFENTDLDLTKGVGAGPFSLPYRWRPLTWEHNEKKYFNERATSTQQTGFSFVAQARSWMPAPIGGILWFGVDDTYSTVYVPIYCGNREAPHNFAVGTGSFTEFTWESAFWVFNWVSNWAYTRYRDIIVDVRREQALIEGNFFAMQDKVERTALDLYRKSPELSRDYLTKYSADQTKKTVEGWREFGQSLFMRFMDGNVRDKNGVVTHPAYPKTWYDRIIEESGDKYLYKPMPGEKVEDDH